ncbi:MAG: hypothetical protein ACRAVC_25565 [Trichormus sp.]
MLNYGAGEQGAGSREQGAGGRGQGAGSREQGETRETRKTRKTRETREKYLPQCPMPHAQFPMPNSQNSLILN